MCFVNNNRSLQILGKAILNLKKMNLLDLFILHVEARGDYKNVYKKEDADNIFSVNEGITPYDTDRIISEFI